MVWGSFVKFGENVFDSQSFGVFLFAAVQYLYGSFIVALLFNYVKRRDYGACPTLVWLISLLVICLAPAFPRNATAVLKDSNYTFYMLLAVYLIILTFDNKTKSLEDLWYLVPLWFFTILLNGFARKSGIHVLILTLPFVVFYIRKNKTLMLSLACVFVVSLAAYFGGEYMIANVYNIPNDDTQESMSIPFQQTARYVRDFGDEVTPEEREAINAVLDYDSLAESYSPELSNPVKDTFKSESTSEDFANYLSVWFKMFFKHPTVYFQATLNGIYGYFYPNDVGYYKDLFFMSQCIDTEKIHGPEFLESLVDGLVDINMKSRNIPVIGVFSSLGFFIWADIFITVFFAVYKKGQKIPDLQFAPCCNDIGLCCVSGKQYNALRPACYAFGACAFMYVF
ncbi:MAG: DUF6020 family protein [Clostridiales bacterium]|nr:DUF6020 family protein [Clostridiales bacterium]